MRTQTKAVALAGAVFALATVQGAQEAHADPYRWCAVYSDDAGGASNCGFITLEQCRATVSGIGGSCEPNQFYDGLPAGSSKPLKRKPQR